MSGVTVLNDVCAELIVHLYFFYKTFINQLFFFNEFKQFDHINILNTLLPTENCRAATFKEDSYFFYFFLLKICEETQRDVLS